MRKKYLDGTVWGGWKVLESLGKVRDSGNQYYRCQCMGCGKVAEVPGARLGVNKYGCRPCSWSKRRTVPVVFCPVCSKMLYRGGGPTGFCRQCNPGSTKYSPTLQQIADASGVSRQAVEQYIRRWGFSAALERYMPSEAP